MISIIIPQALEQNILEVLKETEACFPDAQIIVSTDRYRKGKGWAVRQAMEQATGDIICFIDGDGDISPRMIHRLLPFLSEFDIIVGKKDARVLISRWILTLLSRLYIRIMFDIPVDTQTGVKVFKRSALPNWKDNSFAFDVEILAKAKLAGAKMFEVTVETNSCRKMRLISIVKALIGSIKIWLRLKNQKES